MGIKQIRYYNMIQLIKDELQKCINPGGNYMVKVNNRNTRAKCKMCSMLSIKTPGVFIVNFEHNLQLLLVFLLLILSS